MRPEQRAAIAAALLDTLPAERLLADALVKLTELVVEAGHPELSQAVWSGVNSLHDSVANIAARVAADELAEQAPDLHAVEG